MLWITLLNKIDIFGIIAAICYPKERNSLHQQHIQTKEVLHQRKFHFFSRIL